VERVVLVVLVGCGLACEEAAEDVSPVGLELRVESHPADGATAVPVGLWPELRVAPPGAAETIDAVGLSCGDAEIPSRIHRLADGRDVVQPEQRLPADQLCRLAWSQAGSPRSVAFETFRASAAPGRALSVVYRRSDPGEVAPVPDDFWTVPDPSTPTGLRLELPVAVRGDVREVLEGLRAELSQADGWSPIGPIVVPISDRIDVDSIPRTVDASLDPTATIALVDVDPASPGRGERWPFEAVVRKDKSSIGLEDHALWVLPARPLRPGGRYALLMRRGVASRVGRSMIEPSSIRSILERRGELAIGAKAVIEAQLRPVLEVSDAALAIPWTRDDLVFALPFTVRSLATLARDPLALLADVRALPGPRIEIERVEVVRDPARPLAALVQGRFAVPVWRDRRVRTIARTADGRPFVVGRDALRFVLALPRRAVERPSPILIYQHGNPGSAAEEIGSPRQDAYLEAGFAVIGFTDLWNRGKPQGGADRRQIVVRQVAALADSVRRKGIVPDDWLVTLGEQLALVEALPELAALDVLPAAAPDGRPEIDATLPIVYEGISQGAIHGQALVAYSDRIRAASLVAGGARLTELALHQAATSMVKALPFLFGDFRPLDLWVTLALFQTAIDRQDAHLHALRLHAGPDGLAGVATRPSLLLTAGVDDAYIPTRASRSLAWVLGPLAWLEAKEAGGLALPRAVAPLRGNLADGTTGAYVEIVPYGSTLPSAPGCRPEALPLPEDVLREGHFCAQLAEESIRRRVQFLRSAVDAAPPTVIDPFARRTTLGGQEAADAKRTKEGRP
jgi:hypothetical protein